MTDINQTPSSQPTDLVARFEPARAVVMPKACYRGKHCWVVTAMIDNWKGCYSCKGTPDCRGKEFAHAAVLRRCMVAQGELPL